MNLPGRALDVLQIYPACVIINQNQSFCDCHGDWVYSLENKIVFLFTDEL